MKTNAKPTVAVFNRHPIARFGGTETFSLEVSRRLAHKYDITYFAQSWEQLPEGVSVHKVPKPIKKHMRWFNQLWYAIYTWWHTRGQFDIIHSHEMVWHADIQTIHCPPVKNKLTKPQSFWKKVLRYLGVYTSLRQMTYFGLEKAQFRASKCKKVIGVSATTRNEMALNYPYAQSMFEVVLPGIFDYELTDKAKARELWNIPQEQVVLLMVANDFKIKGVDVAFGALAQLDDTHLYIIGGGQIKEYTDKAKKLDLIERVHFLGQQKDLSALYSIADVFLHPTQKDTFAMVVLEAMYAGIPVIVSAQEYCGISSVLNDSQAMIVQNPKSHKEVLNALQTVLVNDEYRESLAKSGQAFAMQNTWDTTAESIDKLYQDVLACKG